MSERRLADTNFIIRYLMDDHEKHARAAERLFEASDRGEIRIVILPTVLAECVFVLESFYKETRADVANHLTDLVTSPGVEIEQLSAHVDALKRYGATTKDFVDCVVAAHAAAADLAVATFDQDFRKFTDVRVATEPPAER